MTYALPDLPRNIDATYPDASPGDAAHQQHHDAIHGAFADLMAAGGHVTPADVSDASIAAYVTTTPAGPTRTALNAAFVGLPMVPLPAGADNLAVLQAAVNSAAAFGAPLTLRGVFPISGTLLLPSNVIIRGGNGGSQGGVSGLTTIIYTGATGVGTAVVGPANRAASTINVSLRGFVIDTGGLAQISLDLYRTAYSRFKDLLIVNATAAGVGVLLDANVVNQCYFNSFDGCKVDGIAIGVRFQNGANANQWTGGAIKACGIGMEFLSLSAANIVTATDFENNTVKHVYLDAPTNVFIGLHMETCPIGYDITANGGGTRRIGTTFASNVTIYVQTAIPNDVGIVIDQLTHDTDLLRVGGTRLTSKTLSTSTLLQIDPMTFLGTASALIQLFRNVNTTGVKQFNIHKGDGTSGLALALDITTGNLIAAGSLGLNGYGSIQFSAVPPTTGYYALGSLVFDRLPVLGQQMGWICTLAGTPGTWAPLPVLVAKTATATLVAGNVTVANAAITANSIIRLSSQTVAGTPGALFISAKTAGTNFVITSTNAADTSVVQYEIIAY